MSAFRTLSALLLFLSTIVLGQANENKPPVAVAGQPMSIQYEKLKWEPVLPDLGKDSPQISILRVDPQTHATQLIVRAPSKLHVTMHWHSANETHTMIKGSAVFECDGKRERLGVGGFNYIPAKMQHQAWIEPGSLLFITVDSGWDINWVSGPPTKADVGKGPPASGK